MRWKSYAEIHEDIFLTKKFTLRSFLNFNVGDYVFPEIHKKWIGHRMKLVEQIRKSGEVVDIAVDGQCDSPGHNATYCTVTAMDSTSNKVLDFCVINVKEVKNSQGNFL